MSSLPFFAFACIWHNLPFPTRFPGGAVPVVQWVEALDLRSTGREFKSYFGQKMCNNLWQVVHTYVPLSPSSITWYWPKGGDAVWLGR